MTNRKEIAKKLAPLNDYELFHIVGKIHYSPKQDWNEYASAVRYSERSGCLTFERMFADPFGSENYVTDAKVLYNEENEPTYAKIVCGEDVFDVYPERRKREESPSELPEIPKLEDLFDIKYLDFDNVSYGHFPHAVCSNDPVTIPIDVHKLGKLTLRQYLAIERIMNYGDWMSEKYQCCRVPAFTVLFDEQHKPCALYLHIYDYGKNVVVDKNAVYFWIDFPAEYSVSDPDKLLKTCTEVINILNSAEK